MTHTDEVRALAPALALVFGSMLLVMSAYEFTKQLLIPGITVWESHIITIVFTSVIAIILVFFPMRSFHREHQKTLEALLFRQEAEEKLRISEMQYRSFVESVEDSIYTVDRDCRYLLINARHLARRGLSPDAYAGKRYGDFHSESESRVFTGQVKKVLENKSPVYDEYEQGGRYYLRKLNPVIDTVANEVIAVTIISTEITERKQAEKNLMMINRKLNLMNDITRHDMLNQLTVLSSLLALAGEQSGDLTVRKYILRSEQVIDIIHAQINFARDYQKIGVESPQWQSVPAIIQKARQPLKLSRISLDSLRPDVEIYADPLFEKVFFNLLDNAARYAGPDPQIRFSSTEKSGQFLILCEDNGPGIRDGDKEQIFERGFGKNTGLGLFLIREILLMTGITIRENGNAGSGTRFELVVPAGTFRFR